MNEKRNKLQKFASLEWYEAFIEFIFRFLAKTSELLLAVGLVFSAADVLSKGQLMESSPMLLYAWAWAQSIGIEASGGIVLVYGLQSVLEKDTIKAWLYLTLAFLLSVVGGVMLFTQIIASTTGTTEFGASGGINSYAVIMSALRSIVSIGYVVMCRTKNFRFSGFTSDVQKKDDQISAPTTASISVEEIRAIVAEIVTNVVTNVTVQVEKSDVQAVSVQQVPFREQLSLPEHVEDGEIIEDQQKKICLFAKSEYA